MFNFSYRSSLGPVVAVLYGIGLIIGASYGLTAWWLLAYAIHFLIFTFGIGFGMHRSIAHRIPVPSRTLRNFAAVVGVLAHWGSPLSWSVTHNLHHAHSDADRDPHSPSHLGVSVIFGNSRAPGNEDVVQMLLENRMTQEPFFLFLHRYYYLVLAVFFLGAFLLGGFEGVLFGALIPMGTSFLSLGLLNYFAHGNFGYRNFQTVENSRNIWWLWPLTFGENWHNNHHQNPGNPSSRHRFFEWDIVSVYFLNFTPRKFASRKRLSKTDDRPL